MMFQHDLGIIMFFLSKKNIFNAINQLVNQSINQSVSQWATPSVNQSTDQPTYQSINQSINQSVGLYIYKSFHSLFPMGILVLYPLSSN